MTHTGDSGEAYSDVFTIPQAQPNGLKEGMLNGEQLQQLYTDGYVMVEHFFRQSELQPVRDSIKMEVGSLAQKLYNAGKIKELYKQYGLFQRLSKMEEEFPGSAIIMHKIAHVPEAIRKLWSNYRLLNLAEQVLGTEDIVGHPVWNLRTKVPKLEAVTVPWHQDAGYLGNDSYNVFQLTAWIPLLDTNSMNGCMQFMRGGHRRGRVASHTCCHGGTWYITLEEEEMRNTLDIDTERDCVTVSVPYGGAVFFNNLIPHRSLNNSSGDVRWSLDLRWQRADQPVGFYGFKEGIMMRSSTQKELKIDWAGFESVDRQTVTGSKLEETNEFDTTIQGPWMSKWKLVNHNVHTEKYFSAQT